MDKVLKLKHWKVFLALSIASIVSNTTIEDFDLLNSILSIIGITILLLWPMIIGDKLYELQPAKIKLNHTLFLINSFIVLGLVCVTRILFYEEGYSVSGLAALPFFYVVYAYFHIHSFPVEVLKTLELGRKAERGDYIGDFFLMLFWPIGIWFIQPRVNKIIEKLELEELFMSSNPNKY